MSADDLTSYMRRLREMDHDRAELVAARDAMIRQDHNSGATVAELSRATGLTRTMLYKIINK